MENSVNLLRLENIVNKTGAEDISLSDYVSLLLLLPQNGSSAGPSLHPGFSETRNNPSNPCSRSCSWDTSWPAESQHVKR